jgi:topoisomerase-4 subunit A
VVFLDATGRTYSLSAHTLPSARGYGEPLTGRFVLPPGATFTAVIMAPPDQPLLMASDAGYGFITRFEDLVTRNTKGKAMLSLPKGALPLRADPAGKAPMHLLAAVTSEGRMLVFPLDKLPALAKGKGNKIIQIPPKRARERTELLTH